MNKKFLALAVAAALAPAAAMADSGNVTIYGIMDASFDRTDNGDSAAGAQGTSTNKISSNSSRLGFKGTEDVGNGLSAIWQIESQINVDGATAGNTLNSRNTFVGLSSKTAGTAILGRHDTPYKMATRSYDYFGDGLADNRNLMGQGVVAFDGRQSNVLAYMSPDMSGFKAAVAYVAGAEAATASNDKKGDAWSLNGTYANGPLSAALAYERHKFGNVADLTSALAAADKTEKSWKLGAGYNFGALDVSGVYEKTSDDLKLTGGELKGHKAYTLAAKYKIASNDLKLAYTKAGDAAGMNDSGAKQWALGVDHHMSKRTKVYAQYVKLSNENAATYGLNGANPTGSVSESGRAGADPSAWSFGMRHSF